MSRNAHKITEVPTTTNKSRPTMGFNCSENSSDESESDHGMRVGDDFQARVTSYTKDYKYPSDKDVREGLLVWKPGNTFDNETDKFIKIARERYNYNYEQAYGMLFWHKHNIKTAMADLPNFTPIPEEFSTEDKVLFEQAFSFHGKSFARIRQMLPDKSNKSLIEHYYKWKKSQSKRSVIDEKASNRRNLRDQSESSDEENKPSGGTENTEEDNKNTKLNNKLETKKNEPYSVAKNSVKGRRRPPRGMHLSQEDLSLLASGPNCQGDAILQRANADLIALKHQVQSNKQVLSKYDLPESVDSMKIIVNENGVNKITSRWTHEETLLAIQCIKEYGRNYTAISDVIGTKSEAHVKNFIGQYKSKYNLDDVLRKHDEEMAAKADVGQPPPLVNSKSPALLQTTK